VVDAQDLDEVAEARTPGSDEALTALLAPGVYYLIVVDDGGVATRYSVCLALGTSCHLLEEGEGGPGDPRFLFRPRSRLPPRLSHQTVGPLVGLADDARGLVVRLLA
jgi:hypothetical protein